MSKGYSLKWHFPHQLNSQYQNYFQWVYIIYCFENGIFNYYTHLPNNTCQRSHCHVKRNQEFDFIQHWKCLFIFKSFNNQLRKRILKSEFWNRITNVLIFKYWVYQNKSLQISGSVIGFILNVFGKFC